MLIRIIAALMRALVGAITLPLRLIGWGSPRVTAADVAQAALDDPTPEPVRPELTLGQLLRVHAWHRVEGPDPTRPAAQPLPADAALWLAQQSTERVLQLASMRPAELETVLRSELAASAAAAPGSDAALERAGLALLHRRRPSLPDREVLDGLALPRLV